MLVSVCSGDVEVRMAPGSTVPPAQLLGWLYECRSAGRNDRRCTTASVCVLTLGVHQDTQGCGGSLPGSSEGHLRGSANVVRTCLYQNTIWGPGTPRGLCP